MFVRGIFIVMLTLGTVAASQPKSDHTPLKKTFSNILSVDGPAVFFAVHGDHRRKIWTVDCTLPLRGCVARANGLVLSLDKAQQPWLIGAAGRGHSVSVQDRNYTTLTPALFSHALDREQIASLSRKNVFVVVEDHGTLILRAPTQGLGQVVSYLIWLQSSTALTLRDARLWPQAPTLAPANLDTDVLDRLRVLERRQAATQRQLVPGTKPQIEFAIKSQGGSSFFSENGRAGY